MTAQRPPRPSGDAVAEKIPLFFENGALTDALTLKRYVVPAGRELKVERVAYYNATGLVGDNANNFRCELKNGATVVATVFNTDLNDVPAGASLAVGWTEGSLSATPADLWLDAGESLDVVFTEEGTATLPAGNGLIEARLY